MTAYLPVKAIAEFHRELIPMAVATGSLNWVAEKILQSLGIRGLAPSSVLTM